ncbi:MAG TPA: Dabb family protein [Tepidisphaeraceae bacterium]|nr:Dabb family protein [Tepidisphaeraceae bacterium]
MKLLLLALFVTFSLSATRAFAADSEPSSAAKGGALYHVVSFKFKESATKAQIKEVEDAFAALPTKIPTIRSFAGGVDVSPEKRSKGFTHCWVLTFATEKDRDGYINDPAHKAFGKLVGPVVEDVFVIDFWSTASK